MSISNQPRERFRDWELVDTEVSSPEGTYRGYVMWFSGHWKISLSTDTTVRFVWGIGSYEAAWTARASQSYIYPPIIDNYDWRS